MARRTPAFGPCLPLLLCGIVIGALLGPARLTSGPPTWSIWDFCAPLGGVIGFAIGAIIERLKPTDPPAAT